jgi:hypothetical protein
MQQNNQYSFATSQTYDLGLRSFMLSVYNYMSVGLLITALVSMFAAGSEGFMNAIVGPKGLSGLGWLVTLAPLAFVIFLQAGIHRMQLATAQMVFAAYSVAMGLSMSTIFLIYTGESIARVFFITAATFASVSLYGYTTKKDLSKFGSIMVMGLFGIIIASLVNMFLKSTALYFLVSVVGVLVFTGLIAYETQNLKNIYQVLSGQHQAKGKIALLGALTLYISFINLFQTLLMLFGNRRHD